MSLINLILNNNEQSVAITPWNKEALHAISCLTPFLNTFYFPALVRLSSHSRALSFPKKNID